jgi:hypothetical protein
MLWPEHTVANPGDAPSCRQPTSMNPSQKRHPLPSRRAYSLSPTVVRFAGAGQRDFTPNLRGSKVAAQKKAPETRVSGAVEVLRQRSITLEVSHGFGPPARNRPRSFAPRCPRIPGARDFLCQIAASHGLLFRVTDSLGKRPNSRASSRRDEEIYTRIDNRQGVYQNLFARRCRRMA